MNTLDQLRDNGYKVNIVHRRFYKTVFGELYGPVSRFEFDEDRRLHTGLMGAEIHGKGGETEVLLEAPNGTVSAGVAQCSLKDNYNRKLGLRISLGRALK